MLLESVQPLLIFILNNRITHPLVGFVPHYHVYLSIHSLPMDLSWLPSTISLFLIINFHYDFPVPNLSNYAMGILLKIKS